MEAGTFHGGAGLILPLLIGAALASGQHESPQAYVERLYAGYRNSSFNPLRHPARYFSSRLVSALNEDARLAHGEVGYVDGDPICQCQDPAGLQATVIHAARNGSAKAKVQISISLSGYEARPATFSLINDEGWLADRRCFVTRRTELPARDRGIEPRSAVEALTVRVATGV